MLTRKSGFTSGGTRLSKAFAGVVGTTIDRRAFLRRLLGQQKLGLGEMEIDPAALQSLREISGILDNKSLGPSDYASLRRSFDAILNVYYPPS